MGPGTSPLRRSRAPQARQMFECLPRNPGRKIHCTELVDMALGGPNEGAPAQCVAGVMTGARALPTRSAPRWSGERGGSGRDGGRSEGAWVAESGLFQQLQPR
ncbi:DUF6416 domain-containing protein [Streptomyces scabiei]|uniref:DUF6416 domain-containing protein n=1 Tax=Streptomyces scabiei TaxID=1930 RepID=UPI0038F75B16